MDAQLEQYKKQRAALQEKIDVDPNDTELQQQLSGLNQLIQDFHKKQALGETLQQKYKDIEVAETKRRRDAVNARSEKPAKLGVRFLGVQLLLSLDPMAYTEKKMYYNIATYDYKMVFDMWNEYYTTQNLANELALAYPDNFKLL